MRLLHRVFYIGFWAAVLTAFVMAVLPEPPSVEMNDKGQHALAFVVISALARLAYPRVHIIGLFLMIVAFGGLIEIIQMIPALGRTAAMDDWRTDIAATAITLAVLEPLRQKILRTIEPDLEQG